MLERTAAQSAALAEELRNVGRYRSDFRCDPHAKHGRARELFPAELRQVASGDNAQIGRHPLE